MLPDPSQIRVLGPLSAFAAGFADELARQGFTARSVGCLMRLTAHLSRWLIDEGLDLSYPLILREGKSLGDHSFLLDHLGEHFDERL